MASDDVDRHRVLIIATATAWARRGPFAVRTGLLCIGRIDASCTQRWTKYLCLQVQRRAAQ